MIPIITQLLKFTGLSATTAASPPITFELTNWTFTGKVEQKIFTGPAIVPGDIYADLERNGLIPDPLLGDNDQKLIWIGRTDWTYETSIELPPELLEKKTIALNIRGLDTVATVYVQNTIVVKTVNQFHEEFIDITDLLLQNQTTFNITISFRSSVNYAIEQSKAYIKKYGHDIPPNCPPALAKGECHFNFIRKIASSFSWDWGPSFPTVGIWQPISLEAFDFVYINQISATVVKNGDSFDMITEIFVYSAITDEAIELTIACNELHLTKTYTVSLKEGVVNQVTVNVTVPFNHVELWWPKGHGAQMLYGVWAVLQDKTGAKVQSDVIQVGFRWIELVQDLVKPEKPEFGRTFYFKVNNLPVFLKGSNWIPLSTFPARVDNDRIDFLLESMTEANMNALRVWGGGRYESDHFYEKADQLGILLWHDMMYACAEYPTDPAFMDSVKRELITQVNRIKHHPSVLVWSGNNENELGVTSWWGELNYSRDAMHKDYRKLYLNLMKPTIESLDSTRPFLLSSPSNGIETEKEGGISKMDANSDLYGDIHRYIEYGNVWGDEIWSEPRCASEYGIQSMPARRTLDRALQNTALQLDLKMLEDRQHHTGGTRVFISLISQYFNVPNQSAMASPEFMDRFIYMTQVHQAMTYQAETEHYLRWRSQLSESGGGWTMCALYWQLNDLWAAPTWSSIDFDLNWKASHYMARRFFAPIIISTYTNPDGALNVWAVSDRPETMQLTLVLDVFNCSSVCRNVTRTMRFVKKLTPYSAVEFASADQLRFILPKNISFEEVVTRTRLLDGKGVQITDENIYVGRKLIKADPSNYGTVNISSVTGKGRSYEIRLVANGFAPFVWLDLLASIPGWFSDNAFTMLDGTRTVQFTMFKNPVRNLTIDDFTVCSLKDCGGV